MPGRPRQHAALGVAIAACLGLAADPGLAQDPRMGIDLYAAVLQSATVDDLLPDLVTRHGPIDRDWPMGHGVIQEDPDSPLRAIRFEEQGDRPALVLFCDGALMAFDVPVTVIEAHLMSATAIDHEGARQIGLEALMDEGRLRLTSADAELIFSVADRDDDTIGMRATYPLGAFRRMDFYTRCLEGP